jgi:hypothetical protein
MNNAAILPYIGMHALQIQNVKREVVKKSSISKLNHEIVHTEDNSNTQENDTNYLQETNETNDLHETNDLYDTNNNILETGTNIDQLPDSTFIESQLD